MTVEVVQEQAPVEKEPVIGEIRTIRDAAGEDPRGVEVTLESGVTGRVERVVADDEAASED